MLRLNFIYRSPCGLLLSFIFNLQKDLGPFYTKHLCGSWLAFCIHSHNFYFFYIIAVSVKWICITDTLVTSHGILRAHKKCYFLHCIFSLSLSFNTIYASKHDYTYFIKLPPLLEAQNKWKWFQYLYFYFV